ncbi:hypothetical protein HMI56_001488 [Coelomomyces lativittatus]|nr:hypothetical protein HMI56_001488 [Coelomomyces lativittatus]
MSTVEKPKPKTTGVHRHEKFKKKMANQRLHQVEAFMAKKALSEGRLSILKNNVDNTPPPSNSSSTSTTFTGWSKSTSKTKKPKKKKTIRPLSSTT